MTYDPEKHASEVASYQADNKSRWQQIKDDGYIMQDDGEIVWTIKRDDFLKIASVVDAANKIHDSSCSKLVGCDLCDALEALDHG